MISKADFGYAKKTDYPIFTGLNLPDRTYPFTIFLTFLSHTHTRGTVRTTPRPPLVIPWFLHGILELLGEINSPRTGVSVPPTGFPPT
jgi:hypothetical protein